MRFSRVLAIAALGACNADADNTIDIMHDACAPLALVANAPTALQTAGMEAGQALWRDYGAPGLGLRAGATIEVEFQEAAGAFFGFYDDERGRIFINTMLMDPQLKIVIAHELGHAMGLWHVEGRPSVMNPGNLTIPPNDEDRQALQALWGDCQ